MASSEEKWDAYKEAVSASVKAHRHITKEQENAKDKEFDGIMKAVVKGVRNVQSFNRPATTH